MNLAVVSPRPSASASLSLPLFFLFLNFGYSFLLLSPFLKNFDCIISTLFCTFCTF